MPLSGALAQQSGTNISIVNPRTHLVAAAYEDLRVTDARNRVVPANVGVTDRGHAIAISVHDASATYPLIIDPTWVEVEEFSSANSTTTDFGGLQATDGGTSYIGTTVAMSGTNAFIGAYDTVGGVNQGVVFVFIQRPSGLWVQQAELTASDSYSGSAFGNAIAASGNTVVIADPLKTVGGNADQGAVYVFVGTGSGGSSNWTQKAELSATGGAAGDVFGLSVALSGSTMAVGAPYKTVGSNSDQGAAYVFTGSGSSWSQTASLTATDGAAGDFFGNAVAVSAGAVVVGAYTKAISGGGNGAVYMFNSSVYSQSAEFTAASNTVTYLGISISASGNTVVAGAPDSNTEGYENSGLVVVYTESGTTWSQATQVPPPNPSDETFFGESVGLSGTTLSVSTGGIYGRHGEAWVMTGSGSSWSGAQVADPFDRNDYDGWGTTTATNGTVVLTSAYQHQVGTHMYQGVVYAYAPDGVSPTGIAVVNMEGAGGGSSSEPCQCTGLNGPGIPTVQSSGDPVSTATGDFYETATDLSLPGAGVPLAFTRTYDAQAAQAEVANTQPAGPLGFGWTDNLNMSVSYNSTTQVATVTEENGSQTTYAPYVSGTSPAWCNGSTNFCARAPRVEASLNHNSGGSWTFTRRIGSPVTLQFNSSGALTQITDAGGDSLTSSSYTPTGGQTACPSGDTCTGWTSSASGRELVLAVNSSGVLVEVFDANSTLAATFAFSGTGCTSWSGGQTPDLCSATDPSSIVSTYTYDSGNSNAAFVYDMLTATPPGDSGQVTNTYNSSGLVSQQTDPAGEVTTYAYAGTNSSVGGGTTTVTNYPDGTGSGQPTDVTLDTYSSDTLVSETTGYGTPAAQTVTIQRDPNSLLPTMLVDGDGNVTNYTYQTYSGTGGTAFSSGNLITENDGANDTTQHAYNANNQVWCTVQPAEYANGVRCPTTQPTSPPAPGASDPYPGVSITYYNSAGLATGTTDPLGNTATGSYTSGTSGVPNNLAYCTVDPADYQKSVTCPAYGAAHVTGTTTKTYDAHGDDLTSTDADGNSTSYTYGSAVNPGLPTVTTDPDGKVTTDSYNADSEILTQTVTDTSGTYSATTQYAYDAVERRYCEVDPLEYSQSVRCPSSPPTSPPTGTPGYTDTIYNSDGQVISTTNPIGGTTQSAYDGSGNEYCTVSAFDYAGGTRCPSSEPTTAPTIGSDPYLGATITTFDASARPAQVTNPLGGITLSTYDGAGNLASTTVESNSSSGAPNVVTTYAYDADNRVIAKTIGSGSSNPATSLTSYDPNGNAFCTVSANVYAAGSSAYQCPAWQAGWIVSPPSPGALYSTSPTSAQANNVTTTFFNADGTQVQSTNPDVDTSVTVVDADQRTYCTSDPTNVASWLTAHSSGTYPYLCPSTPPTSAPSGTATGYVTTIIDPAGRTLSSTDQVGDTTSYSYDHSGNQLTVTDPRGKVTTNCYYGQNGTGQCAAAAPAGGGSFDDLYSTTTPATAADPSGGTTTYQYYAGDNVAVTVSPGGNTWDIYDANGDLSLATAYSPQSGYGGASQVGYTYNADGSRHTMSDGTGTTTYGYDANGDITSQGFVPTSYSNLAASGVSYTYYTTGGLDTIAYPSSGSNTPTATYTYDSRGDMSMVSDGIGHNILFSIDGDGNTTGQLNNFGNGNGYGTSISGSSYDPADYESSAITYMSNSYSCSLTQSFSGTAGSRNQDGQVTEDSETSSGCTPSTSYERNYSYDQAGRVVYQGSTAQGSNPNNNVYDASGDPTSLTGHDGTTWSQAYDNAGEVTSKQAGYVQDTFGYDTLGDQLLSKLTSTSYATSDHYNQLSQLTSTAIQTPGTGSTVGSTTSAYGYTGDGLQASATSLPTWAQANISDTHSMTSVSCASTSFCMAVDNAGNSYNYNGTAWTHASPPVALSAVSCPSTTWCMAVTSAGKAVIYSSASWGSATSIDGTTALNAVSCVSTTFCVAVDAAGNALTYNGSTWSTASIDGSTALTSVSCTSTTSCVAGDASGYVLTRSGSTWTKGSSPLQSSIRTTGVSCTSSSFCVAVDSSGQAFIYNGSSWTSELSTSTSLNAVSCSSSTSCVAVDSSGNAWAYNGSAWSPAANSTNLINSPPALTTVSCAAAGFCVDGDANGSLWAGGATYTTSQFTWDTNGNSPQILSDGTNDFIYGPTGEPVEQVNVTSSPPTNNPLFLTYTPSDSSWAVNNAAGAEVGFYRYDAFGNLAYGTQSSAFGYAGQYQDTTSNGTTLQDMGARWYNPQTGGFTTRDPAFSQTDQAYVYAGDDPVNASDPTGLGLNPCSSGGVWGAIGDFSGVCPAVSAVTTVGQGLWCAAQINGFTGQGCDSGQGQADLTADLENQGIGILNTLGGCAFQTNCGLSPVAIPYPCDNAGPGAFAQTATLALLGLIPYGDEAELAETSVAGEEVGPELAGQLDPYEKGILGRLWSVQRAQEAGWDVVGQEVPYEVDIAGKAESGTADIIARTPEGDYVLIESKFSPAASFTSAQKTILPALAKAGDQGLPITLQVGIGDLPAGSTILVTGQIDVWNSGPTLYGH